MTREKIPAEQLAAWLFTAMTPPLIQLSAGAPWIWLLGFGILCLALNGARRKWGSQAIPRWLILPEILLLVVITGELASRSVGSWPVGSSYPAVPLILLALAAWSASKGPQTAARVGAVLFWFVIVMYMVVFAAGIGQIRWGRLDLTAGKPEWLSLLLFLMPAAAAFLPTQNGHVGGKRVLPLAMTLVAVLVTQGMLTPETAVSAEYPFFEMSRSLELLGIAQRFEALICAAATAGWYSLLAFLLAVTASLTESEKPGWGRGSAWCVSILAAAWMLSGLHISGALAVLLCSVFWVAMPILAQGVGKIKKS